MIVNSVYPESLTELSTSIATANAVRWLVKHRTLNCLNSPFSTCSTLDVFTLDHLPPGTLVSQNTQTGLFARSIYINIVVTLMIDMHAYIVNNTPSLLGTQSPQLAD